ncbi:MAG: signal peptide peptidase SppA, partial [Euryarchaeota archaeon HGW-Euryarchaeota-1]
QSFKENSFVIVPISGEIATCDDGCASAQKISKILSNLNDNKNVKAIILDINSPGGGVAETEVIRNAVKNTKQNKPIISIISQEGASGAYFVAGASDRIFVHPHAIVGALGVIMSYKYYAGLYEKLGINVSTFKSGEMKDMGADYKEPTTKEQQRFQTIVDTLYNDLLSDFTANRNISSENLERIKTGSIFLGREAIDLNLADEIGGKDQAIDYLKQKLNITNPNVEDYNINNKNSGFNINNFGNAIGEGIAKQIFTYQKQINVKS